MVAVFNVLPPLADSSLQLALWVAVGVTIGSFVAAVLTCIFNIYGRRILERDGFLHPHTQNLKKEKKSIVEVVGDFFGHLKEFSLQFWCLAILNFTFFCLLAFVGFSTVFFASKYGAFPSPFNPSSFSFSFPILLALLINANATDLF